MRWPLVLALLTAACKYEPHAAGGDDVPDDGKPPDAPDAPPDAFDARCFGSGAYYFCLEAEPMTPITLALAVDTTSCVLGVVARVTGVDACVIAGSSITVTAVIGTFGDKPLVLAATNTITIGIGAGLDASSRFTGAGTPDPGPGAASNPLACDTANIDGADQVVGAAGGAGGAGGAFGSAGGKGGQNAKVTAAASPPFDTLRAGCRGGNGGNGGAITGGPGGPGGGAVLLVARNAINIDGGAVDVSGAGALGGFTPKGGGGGGGSGGLIVLHAPVLSVMAASTLIANGGGGGGGASQNTPGDRGNDPTVLDQAAAGGLDLGNGTSAGGDGAFEATAATAGAVNSSGGGGGGGVGVILVLGGASPADIPAAAVSPAPR